jgi:hypothetical protein
VIAAESVAMLALLSGHRNIITAILRVIGWHPAPPPHRPRSLPGFKVPTAIPNGNATGQTTPGTYIDNKVCVCACAVRAGPGPWKREPSKLVHLFIPYSHGRPIPGDGPGPEFHPDATISYGNIHCSLFSVTRLAQQTTG